MLCQQVSCPRCNHRFVVTVVDKQNDSTTGEQIHSCGFLHPSTQPCPQEPYINNDGVKVCTNPLCMGECGLVMTERTDKVYMKPSRFEQ
jgi:hypothetical protein